MCRCQASECESEREEPISVYLATSFDGACNACQPDEYGQYPRRQTFNIKLGGMSFRLCTLHLNVVVKTARLAGWWEAR